LKKLTDAQFKRLIGVQRRTFGEILDVLRETYADKHKRRGRRSNLPVELQLMMGLEYLRQYITFLAPGVSYGVAMNH
jgi:hypothetical protein